MASACSKCCAAAHQLRSRGTFSPKNTTSGLSTLPQRQQTALRRRKKSAFSRRRRRRPRIGGVQIEPVGVHPTQVILQLRRATLLPLATHAADQIEPPVQVYHPGTWRPLDCRRSTFWVRRSSLLPIASSAGQGAMRLVRPCPAKAPAIRALTARPIAPARCFLAHEGLIRHRLHPLPFAVGVRDSRGCQSLCCNQRRSI